MNLKRIFRIIHRDLGFLMVGVSLVYGISGIYLNHMGGEDPAFRKESKTIQLSPNLTDEELSTVWNADKDLPKLNKIMRIDESRSRLFLNKGLGIYNVSDGSLKYEINEKRVLIYWINRLHYSRVKGWNTIADIFAVSLITLAITGLFIVNGKKGLSGSGKWYLIVGILIPILFGILFL